MILGMLTDALVGSSQLYTWIAFFLFSALHLYTNYLSVIIIILKTFNRTRAHLVFSEYISSGTIRTPAEISKIEGVGFFSSVWLSKRLVLGASLNQIATSASTLRELLTLYAQERYLLNVVNGKVIVVLHSDAQPTDLLQSVLQAEILNKSSAQAGALEFNRLERSYLETKKHVPALWQKLTAAGWSLVSAQHLNPSVCRGSWPVHKKTE